MDDEKHAGYLAAMGERLCLDFANTVAWRASDQPQDRLASYSDLVVWGRLAGVIEEQESQYLLEEAASRPDVAADVFERSLQLREAIYRIFFAVAGGDAPCSADVATLNSSLSEAMSQLQIILAADGFAWGWADKAGHLERVLWHVARSAAELLVSNDLGRVGVCAGDGCGWLFFDTSKNKSRRWCSMEDCGNREKARRHYRRQRARQKSEQ